MSGTPAETEDDFYRALSRGDFESMQSLWLDDDSIVCIHPGSDILEGRTAVHAAWGAILQDPPEVRHELQWRSQGPLLAVHVGREWVPAGKDQTVVLAVTNVFQITPDGWRMLLHQAATLQVHDATGDGPVH